MKRTGFAAVPDGRLHYEIAGSGPPVVFIHGFTLDARMWSYVADRLAAEHTVVAYDSRGFGRSSLPAGPYAHRDDLKALLDHLGLSRVHLVGHSIGGHQALEFALAYPDAVQSLVPLCASGLGGIAFPADVQAAFAAIEAAPTLADQKAIWRAVGWFAPALEDPASAAVFEAIAASWSGWHWKNKNPFRPLAPPPAGRLGEIAVPTLVVDADRDLPYNHAVADALAAGIPGAKKVVLAGVGHMAPIEDPAAVSATLLDFFAPL